MHEIQIEAHYRTRSQRLKNDTWMPMQRMVSPRLPHEQILQEISCSGWDTEFVGFHWPAYAWPGGYQMFYTTQDGGVLSPDAANQELLRTLDPDDHQFFIVGQHINYEDDQLFCDHTNLQIPCAYPQD